MNCENKIIALEKIEEMKSSDNINNIMAFNLKYLTDAINNAETQEELDSAAALVNRVYEIWVE